VAHRPRPGEEFAKAKKYASSASTRFPREPWFVKRDATTYAVVIDAQGKIAWGRSDIGGDPIVVVLTKTSPTLIWRAFAQTNVSYFFAGETNIDLDRALEILNEELGVQRLLLEGGGLVNGSFLRAGLLDEISLIVWPVVDGAAGAPCVFDSTSADADRPAPVLSMQLISSESMAGGAVWLRYRLENV
jgi:riboflavin biosynthesis pyrimidine reductase